MPEKHRGILVPMATPFTKEGAIDEIAVRHIVRAFAANGIHCFVLGTTGEAASIPQDQRDKLVQIAVEEAAGRILVYAGIGDNCVANSVAAANRYIGYGVDATVALLPSYYPLNGEEMLSYFRQLAAEIAGPIAIYNIPSTTHMSIPLEVVEELSQLPNIVGYKDSENNIERIHDVAARLGGKEEFSLFMGVAAHGALAMRLGFDGVVPSSGNLAPAKWGDFWEAATRQSWDEAEAIQDELNELGKVLLQNRSLGQSLAALKSAMSSLGGCEPYMLPPIKTISEDEAKLVETGLANFSLPDFSAL